MPEWLELVLRSFWPLLSAGISFTVPLTLCAFSGGLVLGFLSALSRLYGGAVIRTLSRLYVWTVRGTPLLVQLFLIFYGLPSAGIILDPFPAALVGLVVNTGAYMSESMRAAISSIPNGQWEASFSLGMSWFQTLKRIVLPQAVRIAIPSLSNSFIALVKDTSLAAALTVPEMFHAAQQIAAVTYEPLVLYSEAALIYLLFSSVLSVLQTGLEKKLAISYSRQTAA